MVSEPSGSVVPKVSLVWKMVANVSAMAASLGLLVCFGGWVNAFYAWGHHIQSPRLLFMLMSYPIYGLACISFVFYAARNDIWALGWPHIIRYLACFWALSAGFAFVESKRPPLDPYATFYGDKTFGGSF